MYLVDTNVLSIGAPTKLHRPAALLRWMDENSDKLFLSVITIAEIEDGIAKARRTGASRKADRLSAWLAGLLHLYGGRVIPLDMDIAQVLGRLSDAAREAGQAPGFADLAIAATAQRFGYTVLTRNLRHFAVVGVQARDPFDMVTPEGG